MSDRNAVDPSNPQPTDGQELLLAKIGALLLRGLGISGSDIELGAMELKDGGSDVRAKVGVLSGLAATDAGLPVTDPLVIAILGAITGAAVVTDANGTIQQYLRGLVKLIVAKITVIAQDGGPSWTTVSGVSGARFTSADQHSAVASVSDAPTSGQKLVITDIIISVDTAMRVDFNVESSATVIESIYMAANSTVNLVKRGKWKLSTADKKLQVQTSVAGNISVNASYYSEA